MTCLLCKESQMHAFAVKGVVFSGEGIGSQFVKIPWAIRQIREKLGFTPYPGTLNIRLSETEAKDVKTILERVRGIDIVPERGFFPARCFRASVEKKVEGAVIVPEKPGYPSSVLEILAPVNLRRVLSLEDGNEVETTIFQDVDVKALRDVSSHKFPDNR